MRKSLKLKPVKKQSWAVVGVDTSVSSLAGAAMLYDGILDKMRGPQTVIYRWQKRDDYLDRLAKAARAADLIHDLLGPLIVPVGEDMTFIGVEEPFPTHSGFTKRAQSSYLLQQAEISGAFRGGLARYGYRNIYQVNNKLWKSVVASDMGMKQNSGFDKWAVKEWAIAAYGIPEYPDLIQSAQGKIPKPETSKAKAIQPDDIYDAVGVMAYMEQLVEQQINE